MTQVKTKDGYTLTNAYGIRVHVKRSNWTGTAQRFNGTQWVHRSNHSFESFVNAKAIIKGLK